MKLRHLGYACQNLTFGCTTGKTLRLANLSDERVSEVISANLENLQTILEWNALHNILFFRVSSEIVPFASHEAFTLEWQTQFRQKFGIIHDVVKYHDMRLSMHPGQYTVLNSPKEKVQETAIKEIDYHAEFLEEVDPKTGTITLHVGGAYGDKEAAVTRFKEGFARLSPLAQAKLTLENDDKVYNAGEVLELSESLGIPVVFDFFHHRCNPSGEMGLEEILPRVVASWQGRVPKFHLSSAKDTSTAHADFIAPEDFGVMQEVMSRIGGDEPYDVMVEAKMKDAAVLRLMAIA